MDVPPTSSAGSSTASSVADMDKDQIHPPKSAMVSNEQIHDGMNSEDATTKVVTNEKTSVVDPSRDICRIGSTTLSMRRTETREDGSEYPTGLKLFLIIVALCLAVFLMCLDNTIIATAIPKITDQFNSLDDIGWYASCAYSRFSTAT